MKVKKTIPTRIHGYIDYVTGAVLSTSPLYLNGIKMESKEAGPERSLKRIGAEQMVPYSMGVISTAYSLLTNYELGAVKKIPMKYHLVADAVSGVFLATSPWLFGFYKKTWMPFVAMGAVEVIVALLTDREAKEFETEPSLG